MRIKQENLRLKYEIEKHKLDEDRYSKLQYEVEHLTGKLHKVSEYSAYGQNQVLFLKL